MMPNWLGNDVPFRFDRAIHQHCEARLPSVEGGQKPLAPVAVDLQLGGAPHEIQTLHLGNPVMGDMGR